MGNSSIWNRLLTLGVVVVCAAGPLVAAEPDKLLPADTDAVLRVNLKSFLNSALVKKYALAEIKKGVEENAQLAPVLKGLNLNLLEDLHTITVAVSKPATPAVLVIVRGRFERERALGLLDLIAASDPKKFGVSEHNKVKIYQTKEGDQPGFVALPDKETLVLSPSKELVEKAIDQSQGKVKVTLKKELQAVLAKVDDGETVWLAIAASDPVKEAVRQHPDGKAFADKLEGALGKLKVQDGFTLELSLLTKDPALVKAQKAELESGKEVLKTFATAPDYGPILVAILNGTTVSADAGTLRVRVEVKGETIEKLIKKTQENR